MTPLAVLLLLFFALMGAPLFAVLLGASMLGFYSAEIELAAVAIELYRIVDTPLLVALPLFTFSGYVLSAAGTCLLYTSPSPRDTEVSRMPSSA